MSGLFSQLGFGDESVYGTGVAATRFFEMRKESIVGQYERIDSEALRSGTRVLRSDRFAVNHKGAKGSVELEVLNKGFGYFLKHMMGSVATTGSGTFTHTGTVGDLTGDFFTCQVGRPKVGSTVEPFTYEGGKVTEWTLSNAVDGILMLDLGLDFARERLVGAGAYALQAATYPASAELLTFTGGVINIGGTAVDVKDVSVKGENGLADDRYFIRNSQSKKEPTEKEMRKYEVEMTLDFDATTQYARVASATAAGALATFSAAWTSPSGSSLTVTVPALRFDGTTPTVEGADLLEQKLTGMALFDGTTSPVSLAYVTSDATP